MDVQLGLRLLHLLKAACLKLAQAGCSGAGGAGDLAGGRQLLFCQVKEGGECGGKGGIAGLADEGGG